MPKKKPLPKSKRLRRRYLLFEASNRTFGGLRGEIPSLFSQECGARLVKFFPEKGLGILRCLRGSEKKAINSLEKAGLRSLRCSGSLKALKEAAEKS